MNPLDAPSPLAYELPPFSTIEVDDLRDGIERGMAVQRGEIAAIAADTAVPTFENTIAAMERSGQLLRRSLGVFHNLLGSLGGGELYDLDTDVAPRLTAHSDATLLDPALFARIKAVHEARHDSGLDAEAVRLVERYHLDFVLAGAELNPDESAAVAGLNTRIAVLSSRFQQNLMASTQDLSVVFDSADELDGLSAADLAAAAENAAVAGHPGSFQIALGLPTGQPVIGQLHRRESRRRIHEASVARGTGAYDNGPIAIEIARLRADRARLLGYPTHADYVTADATAGTSTAVDALLSQLVGPAVRNARREAALLAEAAAADGIDELAAWDWLYYSDQVSTSTYAVDTAALRPYFEVNRVIQDGIFGAATKLYGITFEPREDLAGYHPDVRVFEVRDPDGTGIGLLLLDLWARPDKRGGAWMNTFVDQNRLLGQFPVVVNNANVTKPAPGEPALLTPDEVRTLFHEFGHALHGLFSQVTYLRFTGTEVPGDFVEFPSQVNEMWQWWPEILADYAFHHETGEPLPAETVGAIQRAELWGQGFGTVEYLAATLLDQAWHRLAPGETVDDAVAFERAALDKAGIAMDLVPPRYRTGYFQHIFSAGYSAGYYFYIWAEVLDADTVEWFKANGGLTRANGDAFRSKLLAVGGSRDAMGAVRDVLGREPEIGPLLRRRGLVTE